MTCEECREKLSDLIEGELPPESERELRAHLSACEDCARALDELRAVVSALHRLPEVEPPTELRQALRRIPDASQQTGLWRETRRVVTVVAAAAAAMLLVWTGYDYYQSEQGMRAIAPLDNAVVERVAPPSDAGMEEVVESPGEASPDTTEDDSEAAVPEYDAGEPAASEEEVAADAGGDSAPAVEHREPPARAREPRDAVASSDTAPTPETDTAEGEVPGTGGGRPATPPPSGAATETVSPRATQPDHLQPRGPTGPSDSVRSAPSDDAPEVATEDAAPRYSTPSLAAPSAAYLEASEGASTRIGDGTPFTVAVRPPHEKVAGTIVPATIALETEQDVARAQVAVTGSEDLELIGSGPNGLIFDGPLTAGQETVLSVRMMARKAGEQRITMRLQSTDPIVDTRLDVGMGHFHEPVPPDERLVQFHFVGTPIRDAVNAIVRESGMRVTVDENVREATVTLRMEDAIPARAALRMIAEAAGCRLVETEDHLVVKRADEEQ